MEESYGQARRKFWERVYAGMMCHGYGGEIALKTADAALRVWEKRWTDAGARRGEDVWKT